jgi:hypothetical protein
MCIRDREIPVAVTAILVINFGLAAQLGRAFANLAATGHWYWPNPLNAIKSVPAILSGQATAGLVPTPTVAAPTGLVIAFIALMELLTLAGIGVAGLAAYRKWGKGAVRGLASDSETEAVLGLSRLRRSAAVVRPDLDGDTVAGHDGYHPHY